MSVPNHSLFPVAGSDLPTLASFLLSCKQALTINRLLFQNWPNDAAQKPLYTAAVGGGHSDPSVDDFKIVDDESGDLVGYLALTRKRPSVKEPPAEKENGDGKQSIPEGLHPLVFAEVMKAVTEIAGEMEGVDHYGRVLTI
jgi:hypothetical protein